MKNIFGINITENKQNHYIDGAEFITRKLSLETQKNFDIFFPKSDNYNNDGSIIIMVLKFISLFMCIIFLKVDIGILVDYLFYDGISFVEAYHNAPVISYIGAASIAVLIFCITAERHRKKKVIITEENNIESSIPDDVEEEDFFYKTMAEAETELNIPEDFVEIDILGYRYKIKKGKDKLVSYGMYDYYNIEYRAYLQDGFFCLADLDMVITIPLSSFREIEKSKKRASFKIWNKSEPYNSKRYKKYKIAQNQFGTYFTRFYKIHISDIKGEFELFIPNYDIDTFVDITKLTVE